MSREEIFSVCTFYENNFRGGALIAKKGEIIEMNIAVQRVTFEQKSILRNLMELYKYDFTEFDPEDVNESGLYEYMFLDHYWTEEGRHPFFIRADDKLAGFALIRVLGTDEHHRTIYQVAEFFVMKMYRGSGVGQHVAFELFNQYHGLWKVPQIETNIPAQTFWRKVISKYTGNNYSEVREPDWDGPIQVFISGSK